MGAGNVKSCVSGRRGWALGPVASAIVPRVWWGINGPNAFSAARMPSRLVRLPFRRRLRAGVVAGMACLLVALIGYAQSATDTAFQDWMLKCDGQGEAVQKCYVFQTLHLRQTGQRVLTVVVGNLGPNSARIVHFTAPLGIHLPAGVALKIDDGEPFAATVETCAADGCKFTIPLDDPILRSLQQGRVMRVGFLDSVTRRQITVAISLLGFSDAFAALAAR